MHENTFTKCLKAYLHWIWKNFKTLLKDEESLTDNLGHIYSQSQRLLCRLWFRCIVLIICWNWTFHFLTHLIFCRWGFRHYSLMADTPTPRASVLRYLQPRVGVSKSEYLSPAYLPKFSKYSNICKIICVWQARCIKTFILGKTILRHNFVPP